MTTDDASSQETAEFITRDADESIDRAFANDPNHRPLEPGEFDPWKVEPLADDSDRE